MKKTLLLLCLCMMLSTPIHAVTITFDLDPAGSYLNPFTSVESSFVQFSEVGSGATERSQSIPTNLIAMF